jgi:hypothetical protein
MVVAENGTFDAAVFLKDAGLGRRIVQLKPKDVFLRREAPPTPFSISRLAAQS